jgi:hypothetical protein
MTPRAVTIIASACVLLALIVAAWPASSAVLRCKWVEFGVMECDAIGPPPISKAGFCDAMQRAIGGPFRWADADTRTTKEQADKINAAGKELCGWGKAK